MKYLLPIVCFLFVSVSYAQDTKFSVTLSYPLPIDKNFIGENYTGVADMGVQYRFVDTGIVKIGASANGSYLVFDNDLVPQSSTVKALFIQPGIFGALHLPGLQKITPSLGIGYTFVNFRANSFLLDSADLNQNQSGFNANAGLSINFSSRFFALLHYDFIKLSPVDGAPDLKFNTNINLLKIGVGFRF